MKLLFQPSLSRAPLEFLTFLTAVKYIDVNIDISANLVLNAKECVIWAFKVTCPIQTQLISHIV